MIDASASPAPLPDVLQEAIGKFTAWSQKHLQAEQDATDIRFPLYHYTDGYGLKGILESGRIWFTDYRHLNDPSELTHGIELAQDVARECGSRADGRVRLFLECFADMFRHDNFSGRLEFFIASFSRARNDLAQWRAYADNGRGFAIGFAPAVFSVGERKPHLLPEFVGAVRYETDEVRARHAAALQQAAAIFLDAVNANADLVRDKSVGIPFMQKFAREVVAQPLIWNCLTSKHPAYKHEQEVRLLIMGTPDYLSPHVTIRFRGSEIVPYIAHPIPVREPHNITEIVIGPAAPSDAERTVRTLLASIGLEPGIAVEPESCGKWRGLGRRQ